MNDVIPWYVLAPWHLLHFVKYFVCFTLFICFVKSIKSCLLGKKSYVVINAPEFSYANETLSCRLCFARVLRKI